MGHSTFIMMFSAQEFCTDGIFSTPGDRSCAAALRIPPIRVMLDLPYFLLIHLSPFAIIGAPLFKILMIGLTLIGLHFVMIRVSPLIDFFSNVWIICIAFSLSCIDMFAAAFRPLHPLSSVLFWMLFSPALQAQSDIGFPWFSFGRFALSFINARFALVKVAITHVMARREIIEWFDRMANPTFFHRWVLSHIG